MAAGTYVLVLPALDLFISDRKTKVLLILVKRQRSLIFTDIRLSY